MITDEIRKTLSEYFVNLKQSVTLVIQTGEHSKRAELVDFLESVCALSPLLKVKHRDTHGQLRSPLSFFVEIENESTGIAFSGIPSGHEFNSFILAILRSSGSQIKLDETVQTVVKRISTPMSFEIFVSLSCHNCPDIVQTLNDFALINPNISAEMIDGGLFKETIEERSIQGVPSVFLNGELFVNGKLDPSQLIDKLIEIDPSIRVAGGTPTLHTQDVVIVGGGPAGVAAAIYSARKGLSVTMIADRLGGQVKDTMGIENLITLAKTTGPELTVSLKNNLAEYGITVKENVRVTEIDQGKIKKVHLGTGEEISCRTIIIATGARWRELDVPGEKENVGNGVAYCPHCDGPFFKGKPVAVVGGGNSGVEAALDLSGIVSTVTIYEYMPELKADQILLDQLRTRDNISVKSNVSVTQIVSEEGKVTAIEYSERENGQTHQEELSGIFVQIGLIPNSQLVHNLVETKAWGEIVVNERCETSETGIYACGDVTTVPYKQIAIAIGEGIKASLSAYEYLLLHQDGDPSAADAA